MDVLWEIFGLLRKTLRFENFTNVLLRAFVEGRVRVHTLEGFNRFSISLVYFRSIYHFLEVFADLFGRSRTSDILVIGPLESSIISLILLFLLFIVVFIFLILLHLIFRCLVEQAGQMFKLNWIDLPTAGDNAYGGLCCVLSVVLSNDAQIWWVNCLQLFFGNLDVML